MRVVGALLLVGALGSRVSASDAPLVLWRLESEGVRGGTGDDRPRPVGSLVKPFVAEAWSRAHPGEDPPLVTCEPTSGCWRPSGHGRVSLGRALTVSCNAYFRRLASETPAEVLDETLRAEGFAVPERLAPDTAIGLVTEGGMVAARPDALLRAYARLVTTPWSASEEVRQTVLSGLRDSALVGTARGVGRRGFWAKTGTVPALDGQPLATSGWAIAIEDSGWGVLALLPRGTGREAAVALAAPLARLRPWAAGNGASGGNGAATDAKRQTAGWAGSVTEKATRSGRAGTGSEDLATGLATAGLGSVFDVGTSGAPVTRLSGAPVRGAPVPAPGLAPVRVALLEALRPRAVSVRNLAAVPAGSSRGFVGPESGLDLRPGDRLDESLWELALPGRRFLRRVRAALRVESGPAGSLRVVGEMTPEEYVLGVLAAELPGPGIDRRVELGAAVLRYLADGPRHATYDVCDSTHCAWFVGRGPRVLWPTPRTPVILASAAPAEEDARLDEALWARVREEARHEGPRTFTGHCGGAPLSAHFVWGNGDRRVYRCDRHASGETAAWARTWSEADLARAFGSPVTTLVLATVDGVWTLRARTRAGERDLRYDEVHRRLAAVLGWDAMPSPPDRIFRTASGFRAEGVGSGHRVGLCLGD